MLLLIYLKCIDYVDKDHPALPKIDVGSDNLQLMFLKQL